MRRLRATVLVALLLAVAGGTTGRIPVRADQALAQQDSGLVLQLTQRDVQAPDGSLTVLVTVAFGGPNGHQVRLIQDRTVLLFDGFAGETPGVTTVTLPHLCGQQHAFVLYVVQDGAVAGSRTATLTLCPQETPSPTPTPTPSPAASPATGGVTRPAPTASPPPPAPPPATAVPAAAPAAAVLPGQPSVPAPPLEPPSLALSDGFVLAEADDEMAANAIAEGLPLVRVLAIWLRGTDSNGAGGGNYQYVEIGNLGGGAQDLSGWALQAESGTMSGLEFYFPDGFTLNPGDSCRVYVDHPAEATCTNGSYALYQFWGDHGTASLWDNYGDEIDELDY